MQALLDQFPHLNDLAQAELVVLLEDLTIVLPTKILIGVALGALSDPRPAIWSNYRGFRIITYHDIKV